MKCVERFRKFFNKEDFDYSHGQIDPYEFYKTCYFLCRLFGVVDKERVPKWAIILPTTVCVCGSIAATMFFISMIHFIGDFQITDTTEAGTYFIIMVYKVLIVSCSFTNKIQFRSFWKATKEDFEFICSTGSTYREKFFRNHLWTWKASILSGLFIAFMAGGMLFCANVALIFFLLQHPGDGTRPLPFPFWISNVDFGKTPIYEIAFAFSNLCVLTHTSTYIFMMQSQIVWIRQVMSKADVIIWSIEDLLVDVLPTNNVQQKEYYETVIKTRMAPIIKMHHSMYSLIEDYSEVYRKLLMFEQKMCAPIVCLVSFCAIEKMDAGKFPGILFFLCIAVIIVTFIPSYMCTMLSEKVKSIGDACWNAPFWNAPGNVICPYFVVVMQISARPLAIQAPGFEEVSLQKFADIIKTAYTGFNMLRQGEFDT